MNDAPVYCPQDEDFLAGVVVDEFEGVMAEVLQEQHFAGAMELA